MFRKVALLLALAFTTFIAPDMYGKMSDEELVRSAIVSRGVYEIIVDEELVSVGIDRRYTCLIFDGRILRKRFDDLVWYTPIGGPLSDQILIGRMPAGLFPACGLHLFRK